MHSYAHSHTQLPALARIKSSRGASRTREYDDAVWTVDVERADTGKTVQYTCNFLFMCTGYYKYDAGYTPHFEGRDRFKGQIGGARAYRVRSSPVGIAPAIARDI